MRAHIQKLNRLDYKDHGTALYYLCQAWQSEHLMQQAEQLEPNDRLDNVPFESTA